ncbi:hypothetical protein DFH08DRAFT_1090617 [Mycena albidolilacea]|uniref:Uncharacterized protein n=1 Tax=Mycena albidolilacea TaxID=1033008 RepID=A0AAD7E681_9AGAR|nr:hypothetical protein DFH08DRAFT_1090617 [Mycena albidolilacea]
MKTTAAHRKKHAAGIHPLAAPYDCVISAHPTHSATSAPDRIRRTSARARKPPPTTSPTAPAAPPPPILLSRLLLAEKRRDEQPPTHPCALRACRTRCRSEGRGSYRAASFTTAHCACCRRSASQRTASEMGQQELVHGQKLLAAREARTYYLYCRRATRRWRRAERRVSACQPLSIHSLVVPGAGEREKLPMGV